MESETQKQLEGRLAELPEDVRLAILSSSFEKKIQTVGAKYSLHIDQTEVLRDETMLVMLGFADPSTFAADIEKQVRVSADQAQKIAAEVTEQLFLPIRESMKKFMEERAEHVEAEAAASVIQTVTPPAPPKPSPVPAPVAASLPPAPATPKPPAVTPADLALSQKTVNVPLSTSSGQAKPQKPPPYKADPYREPPE